MPILLITLLGAALRFYGIGHQGFWYDEAYTVVLMKLSLGRMFGLVGHQESTPPLYYCCAWLWTRVFGYGQAGLRSLSAVFGTAAIPVSYAAARKLLSGKRAALIAAALVACNPLLIWYSQEARAYSLLVLTAACSLLAFAYARERPRPLALALWGVASGLALLTHYYAVLLVIPEAAWLVYEHRYRRSVYLSIGGVALVGVALLPLLVEQSSSGGSAWIGNSPLGERLTQVIPLFLLGPETPARTALKFLAFALVLIALGLLVFGSRRRERQGALLPAGLALAGVLISLLLIPASDTFLARNLLALWLPLVLVVAAGLGSVRSRLLGAGVALALCGIGVTAVVGVASDYYLERPNWQPVAALIGPPPRGGQRLVLVQRNPGLVPIGLYLQGLERLKGNTATGVREIDLVAVKDIPHLGGFCWWGSACNLSPSRLRRHYHFTGFHVVFRRRVEQFWVLKLVSDRLERVTREEIAHKLRRKRLTDDAVLIQP